MATTVFDLMARLGLDASSYNKGLDAAKSAGSALGSGLASAAKVGMAAVTAATGAVSAFAGSAVNAGKNFDTSMSQVAATMGKTMSEMENEVGSVMLTVNGQTKQFSGTLREFAQEMGANTKFSATEAADALNYMALAGYDTQTSMSMLPNVLNLAAAGAMDLARASDMVTDTQTAFGIDLERTTQMVDEMAKAASTGNTSVEQLGDAFLTVGGLAQELNGGVVMLDGDTEAYTDGVQELEIALTAMANAGIKGSEAGTHMRNMLLKLSSPTKDGAVALENLNVEIFDAEGNMKSLGQIFYDLSAGMESLTQEEKIQTIADLFNTRDLAAAEALMNAVTDDWDAIGASILDAQGAAQQMADTQLDNLAGDITIFKSALEGTQIAFSDLVSGPLREFVQMGTTGIGALGDMFKQFDATPYLDEMGRMTEEGARAQAELAAQKQEAMQTLFDTLSEAVGAVVQLIPEAVSAGGKLLRAIGQGLMDNIDVILNAAVDIIDNLLQSLVEATDGKDSVLMQIVDKIANILVENGPRFLEAGIQIVQNIFEGFTSGDTDIIGSVTSLITQIGDVLISNAPMLIESAGQLLLGLATGIAQSLPEIIPAIIDVVLQIGQSLVENADLLIDGAVALVLGLADGLIEALPEMIPAIVEMVTTLAEKLTEPSTLVALVTAAIQLMIALAQGLINAIPELLRAIPQIISNLVGALVGAVPELISAAIQLVVALGLGLIEAVPELLVFVAELITSLVGGIVQGIEAIVDTGKQLVEGFKQGISDAWSGFIENVVTLFTGFIDRIKELFGIHSPSTVFDGFGKNIIEGMVQGITSMIDKLKQKGIEMLVKIVTGVRSVFDKIITVAKELMNKFIEAIKSKFQEVLQLGRDIIENVKSGIMEKIEAAKEWGHDLISNFVNGIKEKWENLKGTVSGIAGSIKDFLGFSEPKLGPLSDFHTYAPDMMELFMKGITDNEDALQNTVADAFDFGDIISGGFSGGVRTGARNDSQIVSLLKDIRDSGTVTVVLEGDADRLFRVMQSKATSNYRLTGQRSLVTA